MFAQFLREHGFDAERGCQHSGGKDSPDIKCNMADCHWEIKFVEKLNLHNAMEQSKRDAGENEMPLVAHKRSREEWLVTMKAEDFIRIYKKGQNNGQNQD